MNTYLAQSLQLPWMDGKTATVKGPLTKYPDLGSILSSAMDYVIIFAGIGLFLMLIAGGYTFLTSAGDSKKLESGRQRITYAIIGFVTIFGAFWIVQIFGVMFGLKNSFQ